MTKQEAKTLAMDIKEFWAKRGYSVRTWPELVGDGVYIYGVRSDMVNGLPKK